MSFRPGAIVAWWDGDALELGLVAGEEKRRLRLIRPRGKDARVTSGRVALVVDGAGEPPRDDPDSRAAAGERLAATEDRLLRESAEVDVALLWEVVLDAGDETSGRTMSHEELAELALGSPSGEACGAVLLALVSDGLHFVRRTDGWLPRDREAVAKLGAERERLEHRREETRAFREHLASAVKTGELTLLGTETERRGLDALEQLALHGDDTPDAIRVAARELLEASGIRGTRPHEGAFRLLRLCGRFVSDDENLQVRRFALRTSFPDAVLAHAAEAAERGFAREDRLDLVDLEAVSIDGPHTREIDDLLSIRTSPAGGFEVGVHIADPGAFVDWDDPVDCEALSRGVTHYMPDIRLPMLPPCISEEAASLVAGEERPALSFLVALDASGEIDSFEITRSVVRSSRRLTYDEADDAIAAGDPLLGSLAEAGRLRASARRRNGAVMIDAPEVEVHVDAEGRPVLERLESGAPSRAAVTEAMVLAGDVAARFCIDAGLPVMYRRQSPPSASPEVAEEVVWDPVTVRRLRRSLRRAEAGLEPGPHAGLGLPAYVQVSSPLRRYQDLTVHRQIVSALRGGPPRHDAQALRRITSTTERAEADARRAEEAAEEFWLLRYLERSVGREIEATVVDTERRVIVQLDETLLEQPVPGLKDVEPGQRVRLTVVRVAPRAGLLSLRPA